MHILLIYLLIFRRYEVRRFRGPIVLRWYDGVHWRPIIREWSDVPHIYRRHPLHTIDAGRIVRVRILVAGTAALPSRARRRGIGTRRAARVVLRGIRKAQRLVRYRRGWKARCYATHITQERPAMIILSE